MPPIAKSLVVCVALLLSRGAAAETIADAFPPPEGAARAPADDFGAWLRARPLRAAGEPVRTHSGAVVHHRARVVDLPLVPGDLQQCADSAIRLRAEWQRERGISPSFKATSGDPIPWSRFSAGERPYVAGKGLAWGPADPDHQTWERWLSAVFTWAGTRSLQAYETRAVEHPQPGDVLVEGGSPGHAVVILDVATRGDETLLLIGEGFMPAMDFHIELGPLEGWWRWTEGGLALPHWPLSRDSLRRWR